MKAELTDHLGCPGGDVEPHEFHSDVVKGSSLFEKDLARMQTHPHRQEPKGHI